MDRVTQTRRTKERADVERLLTQYRLRAGLVAIDADYPILPVMGVLNQALEAGFPDPLPRELWPDPIQQNWPAADLLDLLGRGTFHRACDSTRPPKVRDSALVFLAGIVGLNHPKGEDRVTKMQRDDTHHILGGDWGKPRAWLKRAAESVGYAPAALAFAVAVRDGELDAKRNPPEFARRLAEALGVPPPKARPTLRRTRRTLRRRS